MLADRNNRNNEETWQFNDFRDVLDNLTDQFVLDIFHDYRMDPSKLNLNLDWWNQRLIEGKYFIIRFEFDNNNNKQITIHDVDADIKQIIQMKTPTQPRKERTGFFAQKLRRMDNAGQIDPAQTPADPNAPQGSNWWQNANQWGNKNSTGLAAAGSFAGLLQ